MGEPTEVSHIRRIETRTGSFSGQTGRRTSGRALTETSDVEPSIRAWATDAMCYMDVGELRRSNGTTRVTHRVHAYGTSQPHTLLPSLLSNSTSHDWQ